MDPIQSIKQDHRTVRGLFRRFENADRNSEKQRLGQEIIEELSVHSVIEEQLIYPLLRARGETMEEAVLNALEEHHAVKLVLAELDKLGADHERYEAKMHVVKEAVEMHIEEEESKLLPRLEAALDEEDRRMLAKSMVELRQTAPNYPHPNAPDTPPSAIMSGLLSRITDSAKDVVRKLTSTDRAAGHRRVTRRASATGKRRRRSTGRKSRSSARRSQRGSKRRSRRSASQQARRRSSQRGRSNRRSQQSSARRSTRKKTRSARGGARRKSRR